MCVSRPADPFRSALIMCISSRANQCKKALYRCSFYYNHKWTHWILVRLISVKLKKSIIINWTLPRLDAIIAICHSIEQKTFRWILRNRTKEKNGHPFDRPLNRIRAPHTQLFWFSFVPFCGAINDNGHCIWLPQIALFHPIEFQCGITNGSMVSIWNRFNYGKLVNTFRKFKQNKQCINHQWTIWNEYERKKTTHTNGKKIKFTANSMNNAFVSLIALLVQRFFFLSAQSTFDLELSTHRISHKPHSAFWMWTNIAFDCENTALYWLCH